jgi:sphinganine C4-monooxygenase
MNSSLTSTCAAAGCMPALPAATCATPWYFSAAPSLVRGAPVLAYWGLSLFFHALDEGGWAWPARFRIHDSAEVAQRNKATKADVLKAVVFQQLCQTALGVWWIEEHAQIPLAGHCAAAAAWAPPLARARAPVLGAKAAQAAAGAGAYWVYWWAVPVLQFFWAMCVLRSRSGHTADARTRRFIIDTWQYFLHRAMHVNKFLYRRVHAVHHRLYVPYAFGALYNHPLEGFVLDSVGAALAEAAAGMSVRQAALLFFVSSLKTVDDHCGYALPWDPLQWFSQNGADYHDIHHQVRAGVAGFAPLLTAWDRSSASSPTFRSRSSCTGTSSAARG